VPGTVLRQVLSEAAAAHSGQAWQTTSSQVCLSPAAEPARLPTIPALRVPLLVLDEFQRGKVRPFELESVFGV